MTDIPRAGPSNHFGDLLRTPTRYDKKQPNFAWWSKFKLDETKIFTGSTMPSALANFFGTNADARHQSWCCYRQDARAANSRYWIYSQSQNQVYRPQGRLVAPIHVKLGMADGHLGRLAVQNFTSIGSQNIKKIPLFGKESPRRGEPLDRFLKFLRTFIRLTILH